MMIKISLLFPSVQLDAIGRCARVRGEGFLLFDPLRPLLREPDRVPESAPFSLGRAAAALS